MKEIVVGCRTDCHQVMSAEPTAIATNNKRLLQDDEFFCKTNPTTEILVLSAEQTDIAKMGLSPKETAVTK
jgi:hypothetical protein